ncbi:MAG TPA: AMP-binding protein [Kofleriaceae bacterium]|nr:AMP-binding protein [Kofleriaceae bacterium]
MKNHSLGSWIARRAVLTGHRTAIIYGDQRWTYGELHDRMLRLARALQDLGIRQGDRVAFLGPNHPGHLECLFACGLLGAIAVPLHFRFNASELTHAINEARCEALIFAPESEAVVESIRNHLCARRYIATANAPSFALDYEELLESASTEPLDREVTPDDVALINFTSGTTGTNKGVVLTHGNLIYNVFNFLSCSDYLSDDVMLTAAPLYRMGGLGTLLPVFFKGGTALIIKDFDPDDALAQIERHRVTVLFNGPKQFAQIAASPKFASSDLSSLRFCMCGGDVVPQRLIEAYLKRNVTFQQGYGLTETSPLVLLLDKDDSLTRLGSAGRPPLFTETRVVREDFTDVEPGEIGELVVRGPNVMTGYWEHPEWTEAAFEGEWLRTGDAAKLDDDGFVYIVDRIKDAMWLHGHRVFPAEIEVVLGEHPSVLDCAVVSEVDAAVAFVVPRPGVEVKPDELVFFCWQRVPSHMAPKQVRFVSDLPRNVNGKLMRRKLRELLAQGVPQAVPQARSGTVTRSTPATIPPSVPPLQRTVAAPASAPRATASEPSAPLNPSAVRANGR